MAQRGRRSRLRSNLSRRVNGLAPPGHRAASSSIATPSRRKPATWNLPCCRRRRGRTASPSSRAGETRSQWTAMQSRPDAKRFDFILEPIRNSPPNQHVLEGFATAPARTGTGRCGLYGPACRHRLQRIWRARAGRVQGACRAEPEGGGRTALRRLRGARPASEPFFDRRRLGERKGLRGHERLRPTRSNSARPSRRPGRAIFTTSGFTRLSSDRLGRHSAGCQSALSKGRVLVFRH